MYSLIHSKSQLLFFKAVQYGQDSNQMGTEFINILKTDAVKMSMAFARRYYTVVYEADLRQASQCVLGIMNLGLTELSGNRIDKAARLLVESGGVELFREGWTMVSGLVKKTGEGDINGLFTNFEQEKDFSESFSALPDREWSGHNEYCAEMLMAYHMQTKQQKEDLDELF